MLLGGIAGIYFHRQRRRYYYQTRPSPGQDITVRDLHKDLKTLFWYLKPQKFTGLLHRLNDPKIIENLIMVEDTESFTMNKKTIHLCTKNPKTGFTYDKNTLMFVVLHELAHVLCKDVGHTETFSKINESLLVYAAQHKYYDPRQPFVANYCSL
jgi:Zn-dependent peptidase ImmA (M78 family)